MGQSKMNILTIIRRAKHGRSKWKKELDYVYEQGFTRGFSAKESRTELIEGLKAVLESEEED